MVEQTPAHTSNQQLSDTLNEAAGPGISNENLVMAMEQLSVAEPTTNEQLQQALKKEKERTKYLGELVVKQMLELNEWKEANDRADYRINELMDKNVDQHIIIKDLKEQVAFLTMQLDSKKKED